MSSNEELWDQLAQRVMRSQLSGIRPEDDDVLAAADLVEATINPHRTAQAGMAGAGSPGMMPPMMMGGAGGGAGTATSTAAAPRAADPVAPLSAPVPTPSVAGVPGEARPLPPKAGSSVGGGSGAGGSGPSTAGGATVGTSPAGEPGAEPTVEQDSAVAGVAMTVTEEQFDGFAADPQQLQSLGQRWVDVAGQLAALTRYPEAQMGLFEDAQVAQQALSQQVDAWRRDAVEEFEAMAGRLHRAAAEYGRVDDEGVAEARRAQEVQA